MYVCEKAFTLNYLRFYIILIQQMKYFFKFIFSLLDFIFKKFNQPPTGKTGSHFSSYTNINSTNNHGSRN